MKHTEVMLILSVFVWKYPYLGNLFQKLKIVFLS